MIIAGRNPVLEALKSGRTIECLYIKAGDREGSIKKILGLAKESGLIVKETDRQKLTELCGTIEHQGVAAKVSDFVYADLDILLESIKEKAQTPLLVILDEIEDPHNLGAIIRSAEAAGAQGVIIPKRRSAQVSAIVEKSAAGAASYLPVARVGNLASAVDKLKEHGLWIYGLHMEGTSYSEVDLQGPAALIVGSEGRGISRLLKEKCDFLLAIPMLGQVGSLNASVATSIILFETVRQRQARPRQ